MDAAPTFVKRVLVNIAFMGLIGLLLTICGVFLMALAVLLGRY